MDFVDHFRHTYSVLKSFPEGFTDMVHLLVSMPDLQNRPHLCRFFRLSCLCLSEDTALLPPIKFQDVDGQRSRCRLSDVLLPAQSHLTVVLNGIANCTSEGSLAKFEELGQQFNSGNMASDPWSHVDSFGRAKFQKVLASVYKASYRGPKPTASSRSASESESTSSTHFPSKTGRKVVIRAESTPGVSNTVKGVRFSPSKPSTSKD